MSDNVLDARMTLENSGFISAMSKAHAATSKAMEVMKAATLGITGLGAAFGAFRSVEGVIDGVMSAFQRGRELMDLSRQTTTNVRDLVILQQAFRDTGASADSVGHTVFMLQKALGGMSEEGLPTAHIFAQLGLSIGDLKKMDTVSQFQAISKGLSGLKDPSQQSAAAMQIFGRSAMEVMGLLRDPAAFATATRNVGGIGSLMARNAAAFDQVSKSMELIKTNVEGLFAGVASGLAPALQQVADTVNKIDFTKWGQRIGEAAAMIVAAFKNGSIMDIIGLSLTIAFKTAVNIFYSGMMGAANALASIMETLPERLEAAFAVLTNSSFWKGIAQLAIGSFLSFEGTLNQMFIRIGILAKSVFGMALDTALTKFQGALQMISAAVPGLGVALAALKISGYQPTNQSLAQREQENATQFAGADASMGKMAAQGASLATSGASLVATAMAPMTKALVDSWDKAVAAFQEGAKQKGLDVPEIKQLAGILAKLHDAVRPRAIQGPPAPGDQQGDHGLGREHAYKPPDADRLAKIGLFVGGSPATPGLTEAKRTAAASEQTNKLLTVIEGKLVKGGWQSATAYTD